MQGEVKSDMRSELQSEGRLTARIAVASWFLMESGLTQCDQSEAVGAVA